jgi:hypothetical protein
VDVRNIVCGFAFRRASRQAGKFGHDPKSNGQIEIVGVVCDAKYQALRDDVPATIFLPRLQNLDAKDNDGMTFAVRAVGDRMI